MAEIGGPLAHQLNPLQNHRGGLVQPSLVMNHHLDPLDNNGGGTCHAPSILPSKFLIYDIMWK